MLPRLSWPGGPYELGSSASQEASQHSSGGLTLPELQASLVCSSSAALCPMAALRLSSVQVSHWQSAKHTGNDCLHASMNLAWQEASDGALYLPCPAACSGLVQHSV